MFGTWAHSFAHSHSFSFTHSFAHSSTMLPLKMFIEPFRLCNFIVVHIFGNKTYGFFGIGLIRHYPKSIYGTWHFGFLFLWIIDPTYNSFCKLFLGSC